MGVLTFKAQSESFSSIRCTDPVTLACFIFSKSSDIEYIVRSLVFIKFIG